MRSNFVTRNPIFRLFHTFLPDDMSHQVTAQFFARQALSKVNNPVKILDLGCGAGDSATFFEENLPNVDWHGVDIEDSPEVRARKHDDVRISCFDGVHLPYPDNHFDIVYTRQVFEHVRHPDLLLRDVTRILKDGGAFVGSVSYLEPYHSYSIFNFTPYAIVKLFDSAHLKLLELRPSIDGITVILRQLLNKPRFLDFFFEHTSPLNALIDLIATLTRLGHKERNFLKLQFTGIICFFAVK